MHKKCLEHYKYKQILSVPWNLCQSHDMWSYDHVKWKKEEKRNTQWLVQCVRFNKDCVALIWASCPMPYHYLYSAFAVRFLYLVILDEGQHTLMQVKMRAEGITTTRPHLEMLSVLFSRNGNLIKSKSKAAS